MCILFCLLSVEYLGEHIFVSISHILSSDINIYVRVSIRIPSAEGAGGDGFDDVHRQQVLNSVRLGGRRGGEGPPGGQD